MPMLVARDVRGQSMPSAGRGRARALRVAHRTGRFARFRRGQWTEKHMTLGRAHAERPFSPERFYRFFEWTPGHDQLGHPHFHVWLLCGWIDHAWIARCTSLL
jgi:hypothetical protein